MPSRWKGSPEAPPSGFFGGWKRKSKRGMRKVEPSSKIRRRKTWEVQKPKRARSPLSSEEDGMAGGAAGFVGENR
jgi:hypothetical protein